MKKVRPIRDAMLSALIVLISAHLAIFVVAMQAKQELLAETRNHSRSLAETAAAVSDTLLFQTFNTPLQKQSIEYAQFTAPHQKILSVNPDLRYVYTMIERNGKIYFISDSQRSVGVQDNTAQRDTTASVMEEYTEGTETLKRAFRIQSTQVEEEPYTDQWGTTLSAYTPLFDASGKFVGIIGIDYDVKAYNRALFNVTKAFSSGSMLSILMATIVFYFMYNARLHRARYQNLRQKFNQQMQNVTESLTESSTFIREKAGRIVSAVNFAEQNTNKAETSIRGASLRIDQISFVSNQLRSSLTQLKEQSQSYREFLTEVAERLNFAQRSISGLTVANEKITTAMAMIPKITAKINMVALNATIEAARAGEVGKGFVVVANEVKTLARQTDEATAKIAECIKESQDSAMGSAALVETIDAIVVRVKDMMSTTDMVIDEQTSMLADINTDIAEVAEAAKMVENIVHDVNDLATNVKSNTDDLYQQLESLEKESMGLESKVNHFINYVESGKRYNEHEVIAKIETPPPA